MASRELSYQDLLKIAEVIRAASHFGEFRLKVGDIEVNVRRANGAQVGSHAPVEPKGEPEQRVLSKTEAPADAPAVHAPMVGTFYRAPALDAPPFVEAGSKVEPGTVVGIIEVMKLMNQVEAGLSGVVREVLVGNAQSVEHGQPLMLIDPS